MKTSELTGAALDWAVAKCEGATEEWHLPNAPFLWGSVPCIRMDGHDVNYRPSTNWAQAGPLIEREGISVNSIPPLGWMAITNDAELMLNGDTPLIAAMRCYVASKLGDDVEIPQV